MFLDTIDTNLLPAPFTPVPLANGQTASYRNWNTTGSAADPIPGSPEGLPCNTQACFVNPLIVQNNQYSSQSYALYEGGIAELTKRLSARFCFNRSKMC